MEKVLAMRVRAKYHYERVKASETLSTLANTVPRRLENYQPGQLVMYWRQKAKPGKMSGHWLGPARLVLAEQCGSVTLWIVTGDALIKAEPNQIRKCTRREELQATVNGSTVVSVPSSPAALLRTFHGRCFQDITGDTPSEKDQDVADFTFTSQLAEPKRRRSTPLTPAGTIPSATPVDPTVVVSGDPTA